MEPAVCVYTHHVRRVLLVTVLDSNLVTSATVHRPKNYEDNTHSPSFPRICIEDSICMADGCVSANVTLYDLFSFQRRENVFARRYRKTNRRLYNVVGLFISVTWGRRVKRRRHFYCSGLPPFFFVAVVFRALFGKCNCPARTRIKEREKKKKRNCHRKPFPECVFSKRLYLYVLYTAAHYKYGFYKERGGGGKKERKWLTLTTGLGITLGLIYRLFNNQIG